jgi:hypothetical protein
VRREGRWRERDVEKKRRGGRKVESTEREQKERRRRGRKDREGEN